MEQFDKMIQEMAEKEEMIVPKGFDERVQGALEELPPRQKKRKPGAVKTALIAAAACLLLVGTALAASPELRGILMDALGSFAPYAVEQEDNIYTADGFELKVLSTLTDGSTIRAYVQVKDREGHRLSADMSPLGHIHVYDDHTRMADSYVTYTLDGWGYAVYDEVTETALLVFNGWGDNFADLSSAELDIFDIYDFDLLGPSKPDRPALFSIPLTVEATDKLTFDETSELAEYLSAKWVELSPLGLTAVFEYDTPVKYWTPAVEEQVMFGQPIRVRMKDGAEPDQTEICVPSPSREAYYSSEAPYRVIQVWNFPDAIDLEQVESVFMNGKYFPVN